MRHNVLCLVVLILLALVTAACGERTEVVTAPATGASTPVEPETEAPAPPVRESFDAEPQLSLFPRIGAYRPDGSDAKAEGVWAAYIDHLQRLSGMREKAGRDESRGWIVPSLSGAESLGFFAPLAVRPGASYRVSFDFAGELPKGGSAGVGIIEFDQFLWVGEQFGQTLLKEHQTGVHPGVRLTGKQKWASHSFTFKVSPRGRMIHLLLFRDGKTDRKQPVRFDNIAIEEVAAKGR